MTNPPPEPPEPLAPGPADGPYTPPPPPPPPTEPLAAHPPAPTAPYASPAAPAGPSGFARPGLTFTVGPDQLTQVLVALGIGLLSAAVVVSTVYSRRTGDLDWSNFVVGVLATLALLVVAGGAQVMVTDPDKRASLASWTGAFGTVGVGLMLGVAITNGKAAGYVGSIVIIALSVGGYLLTQRPPFVLSAIIGVVILYGRIYGDAVGTGSSGDNFGVKIGTAVFIVVVLLTVAGWLLPTRVLSGVVVGIGGLVAMDGVLVALIVARTFLASFSDSFDSGYFSSGAQPRRYADYLPPHPHDPYKNDVWTILVFCVLLAVLWAVAALLTGAETGQVGFRLLVIADAATVIPLASAALLSHHPTWWGAVPLVIGGAVLGLVGLREVGRPRQGSTPPPAYPPAAPTQPGQPGQPGGPTY